MEDYKEEHGKLEFLQSRYKEPQKVKLYDFSKYSSSARTAVKDSDDANKKKFDLKNLDFTDERQEFNPVQTDVTDSKYLFNNQDAIIVNLKKRNSNQ